MIHITRESIMRARPCTAYPLERVEELVPADGASVREVASATHIPVADRVWVLCRALEIPDDIRTAVHNALRLTAVSCARRVLSRVEYEWADAEVAAEASWVWAWAEAASVAAQQSSARDADYDITLSELLLRLESISGPVNNRHGDDDCGCAQGPRWCMINLSAGSRQKATTMTKEISRESVGQFFLRPSDGGSHTPVAYATCEDGRIVRRDGRADAADTTFEIGYIDDDDDTPFEPWNDSVPRVSAWHSCRIVD